MVDVDLVVKRDIYKDGDRGLRDDLSPAVDMFLNGVHPAGERGNNILEDKLHDLLVLGHNVRLSVPSRDDDLVLAGACDVEPSNAEQLLMSLEKEDRQMQIVDVSE